MRPGGGLPPEPGPPPEPEPGPEPSSEGRWGPPAGPGPGGRLPEPERRWYRQAAQWLTWRRTGAGLAMVLVAVLLAPTPLVDLLVTRVVSSYGSECVALSGVRVDSGSWPVVARALTGRLQDVSVDVDEVRFDSYAVHDVSFAVARADVAPMGAALLSRDADVRGGEATGTIRFGELERIIGDHGVDVALRREGPRVMAAVEVPVVGPVPTGVTAAPADGDLEIQLAPLDLVTLPPLRITPAEPFRIDAVEVRDDGVRVGLAFDGELAASDSRCDATVEGS